MRLTKKQKAALKKEAIKTAINIVLVIIVIGITLAVAKNQLNKAFEKGIIGKDKERVHAT